MKKVKLITSKELKLTAVFARKLFQYNPKTGILRWRHPHGNRVKAGAIAGCLTRKGYLIVGFDGTLYLVHRVIWLMQTGKWPEDQIDHENHIRSDNRWKNLSEATHQENGKNQKLHSTNTSGTTGVYWYDCRQEWHARIMIDGKCIHLGYFTNKQDAVGARKKAEIKYGYHDNHGTETATVLSIKKQKHSKRRILPRTLDRVQLVHLPIAA